MKKKMSCLLSKRPFFNRAFSPWLNCYVTAPGKKYNSSAGTNSQCHNEVGQWRCRENQLWFMSKQVVFLEMFLFCESCFHWKLGSSDSTCAFFDEGWQEGPGLSRSMTYNKHSVPVFFNAYQAAALLCDNMLASQRVLVPDFIHIAFHC